MDGEWFYASRWGVPDLHFDKYDDENDHPYHEYGSVEFTDEAAIEGSVWEFLERVVVSGDNY